MRSRAQTGAPEVGVFITPQLRQDPRGDLATWQLFIFGAGVRTWLRDTGRGWPRLEEESQESHFSEGFSSLQAADIPPPRLQAGCLKHGCSSHSIFPSSVQVTLGMATWQRWQCSASGAASQAGGSADPPPLLLRGRVVN